MKRLINAAFFFSIVVIFFSCFTENPFWAQSLGVWFGGLVAIIYGMAYAYLNRIHGREIAIAFLILLFAWFVFWVHHIFGRFGFVALICPQTEFTKLDLTEWAKAARLVQFYFLIFIAAAIIPVGLTEWLWWRMLSRAFPQVLAAEKKRNPRADVGRVIQVCERAFRPGMIPLGVDVLTGKAVLVSTNDLATHLHLLGSTGSGKTSAIIAAMRYALWNGWGIIIIDGKGSGLYRKAKTLAEQYKRYFNFCGFSKAQVRKSHGYNPFIAYNLQEFRNLLLSMMVFSEPFYETAAKVALGEMLFKIFKPGQRYTLEDILNQLPDDDKISILRNQIKMLMHSIIYPSMRAENTFTPLSAFADGAVCFFSISVEEQKEDARIFGKLVLQDILRTLPVVRQLKNKKPVMLIIDEFGQFATAQEAIDLASMARDAGCCCVFSHQSFSNLEPQDIAVISDNTRLKMFGVIEHGESREMAAKIFGSRRAVEETAKSTRGVLFSSSDESGTLKTVEEFIVHPSKFSELAVGQFYLKTPGSKEIKQIQVPLLDVPETELADNTEIDWDWSPVKRPAAVAAKPATKKIIPKGDEK